MRLIADLEAAPRGVYCGAIGFAAPEGDAVFNVAIRTITVAPDGTAAYGIGGGITWDSDAGDEYGEAISKAACLTVRPDRHLFETFRLEDGALVRLDAHLARLSASARYFGWPFDLDAAARAAHDAAAAHADGIHRVRLNSDRYGEIDVHVSPLDPPRDGIARVAIASTPIDGRDARWFHKTSDRGVYDAHAAAHPEAFDVLLWNDAGEATEFTRANAVFEFNGRRVTPPLTSGLLPGVLRAELLARGEIHEASVRIDDVARATRIWCVNSLRGWIEVGLH
jgi:para-aminobenzoate synthetase/4-amino-4-deoxychorismate lyase